MSPTQLIEARVQRHHGVYLRERLELPGERRSRLLIFALGVAGVASAVALGWALS